MQILNDKIKELEDLVEVYKRSMFPERLDSPTGRKITGELDFLKEVKKRHETKVEHLAEDIQQMKETITDLNAELAGDSDK